MLLSILSSPQKWFESSEESDQEEETFSLDEDDVYELLGNERRRTCLTLLSDSDREWDVSNLSERVAADVADSSSVEDIYDSVYISICQNHLPKLDDVDVVEYDSDAKTVRIGPGFDDIEQHWVSSDESTEATSPDYSVTLFASIVSLLCLTTLIFVPTLDSVLIPALLGIHFVVLGVELLQRNTF